MRVATLAVALVLLCPSVAAWSQWRGEADRSVALDPPRGVLDVAAVGQLTKPGQAILGRASPHGVAVGNEVASVVVTEATGQCLLVRGTLAGGYRSLPLSKCQDGRLQAYWPGGGLFLVCMTQESATGVIAAYDGQGVWKWTKDPRDLFQGPEGGEATQDYDWACDGSALLGDSLIVPFLAASGGTPGARHRISWIDLPDGEWGTQGQVELTGAVRGLVEDLPGLPTTSDAGFIPLTVSALPNGVLVTGLVPCEDPQGTGGVCREPADGAGYMGAIAWLDANGTMHGLDVPKPYIGDVNDYLDLVQPTPVVSVGAAGDRGIFVVQVGSWVYFIDPTTDNPLMVQVDVTESRDEAGSWPAPVWIGDSVAVATDRRVTFLGRAGTLRTPSSDFTLDDSSRRIVDLAGDRNGRLFILTVDLANPEAGPGSEAGKDGRVTVLDNQGLTLHELPVTASMMGATDSIFTGNNAQIPQLAWRQSPQFMQVGDEFAIMDAQGRYILLQDDDTEPALAISNLYPAPSEFVRITLTPNGEPRRVFIRWGNGNPSEDVDWPANQTSYSAENFYTQARPTDLIVTVLDEDGTTQTAARTIHVGDDPPTRQTFVQWAFNDKNVDNTWGILGIILTILGGAYGYWRLQRSRRRLGTYTKRLHDIRTLGHTDALSALRQLQDLRAEVRDRAAAGSLDHTQLQLIEARAASTARTLLFQAIAPFRDRLSPVYQGMLSGFFEDGRVGEQEADSALEGINAQTRLRPADRTLLAEMFHLLRSSPT